MSQRLLQPILFALLILKSTTQIDFPSMINIRGQVNKSLQNVPGGKFGVQTVFTTVTVLYSTGLVLAANRIQILAINRHRNLIDSWRSTGLLLVQY